MEAPGGAAAAGGPPRFQCPEEFCARRFAPGPALCPETLRGPAKQLLLIRAPASFSPESLTGHTMPLFGSHAVKASQQDGIQKAYSLQMRWEDLGGSAHLLIPSGQRDRLTCAPPFSGSLSIWERYGDPGAAQPLFPVTGRLAPQASEGLKQRFFPFGGWPKRPPPSSEAPETPPKSKKRRLQVAEDGGAPEQGLLLKHEPWGEGGGPEQLPGGLKEPARGLPGEQTGAKIKRHPLKGEAEEVAALQAAGWLLGRDAQLSSRLEEGLLPGRVEDPERRSSKKKKKRKNSVETEELLDPNSRDWQPEQEPWLQEEMGPEGGGGHPTGKPALGGCRPKKKRRQLWEKVTEGLQDVAAAEDDLGDTRHLGSLPEESLGSAKEESGGELPSCKSRRKRRKGKGGEQPLKEPGAEMQSLESCSLALDWDALGAPLWREAGPEEPPRPDGVALSQRPKKRRRRREQEVQGEDQAGLSAAGT